MSRVPYAMEDFARQCVNEPSRDEIIADRIAKRHKVCAAWGKFGEVEFFDLDSVDEEFGAVIGFNAFIEGE